MANQAYGVRAMWTALSITCQVCGWEIPVRVNGTDAESVRKGAETLPGFLIAHIRRDHGDPDKSS